MKNVTGYTAFQNLWQENAKLAMDTIALRPVKGTPNWILNDMQWSHLAEISGNTRGSYEKDPVRVYRELHLKAGCCFIDQWIPTNPLSMKDQGYEKSAGLVQGLRRCQDLVQQRPAKLCVRKR
jgi:hypothetical protein